MNELKSAVSQLDASCPSELDGLSPHTSTLPKVGFRWDTDNETRSRSTTATMNRLTIHSTNRLLANGKLEFRPLDDDWLKLGVGYNREQRESSFDWYSYRSNQVFAEASAEF